MSANHHNASSSNRSSAPIVVATPLPSAPALPLPHQPGHQQVLARRQPAAHRRYDSDDDSDNDQSGAPAAAAAADANHNDRKDASIICRICFEGSAEGILISPCVCRGSMKYVHRACLERWRNESENPRAAWECGLCKYEYSFRRSQAARCLSSKFVLHVVTLIVFINAILIGGVIGQVWQLRTNQFVSFHLRDIVLTGSVIVGVGGFFGFIIRSMFVNCRGWHLWDRAGDCNCCRGAGGGDCCSGGSRSSGGSDCKDCGKIILIIIVAIGLVYALLSVYKTLKHWSHTMLCHAAYVVENVHAVPDPLQHEQQRPAAAPGVRQRRRHRRQHERGGGDDE